MQTVAEITRWLNRFAPFELAESWDNVGLLWGDPAAELSRVMTCLTVTPRVAREAISEGAGLILSHHPVLFRAAKQIRADSPENGMLWELARAGVAVASPHTAFDNTEGGINDGLAHRLGLLDLQALRPFNPSATYKVVVFVPEPQANAVLQAAFSQGAGEIGAYRECSYSVDGVGTFFGTDAAKPAVGQAGRREQVDEKRVEILCGSTSLEPVLASIRAAHPYEEPAIDVYPLHTRANPTRGAGRVGLLPRPITLGAFARLVRSTLGSSGLQVVGPEEREVERVAIVCGAGDDFLSDAVRHRADVLLTGEARFHRALEAETLNIGLVVAGHHATERPGVEDLAQRVGQAFPGLTAWASRIETDPLWTPSNTVNGTELG